MSAEDVVQNHQEVERGRVGSLMAQIAAGLVVLDSEQQGMFERHYPVIMGEMNKTASELQSGLYGGVPKEDAFWGGPKIEQSQTSMMAEQRAGDDLYRALVDSDMDLAMLATCLGFNVIENKR